MVKDWSNRNGKVASASTAGRGRSSPARRPNAHAATGRVNEPRRVASLKATPKGITAAEDGRRQVGEREVEGVEREAVVGARVPTGQVEVREQVRLQVRGQRHMGAGVTARRRRVGEAAAPGPSARRRSR